MPETLESRANFPEHSNVFHWGRKAPLLAGGTEWPPASLSCSWHYRTYLHTYCSDKTRSTSLHEIKPKLYIALLLHIAPDRHQSYFRQVLESSKVYSTRLGEELIKILQHDTQGCVLLLRSIFKNASRHTSWLSQRQQERWWKFLWINYVWQL